MDIVLWGTGKVANVTMDFCQEHGVRIIKVVDNNEIKWGKVWRGYRVCSPMEIKRGIRYDKIVIAVAQWQEIYRQLREEMKIEVEKIDNMFFIQRAAMLEEDESKLSVENAEKKSYLDYIRNNPLTVFNDKFVEKYWNLNIEVFWDEEYKLYYVMHKQKKMYMNRKYDSKEKVRNYYRSLLIEQDEKSPHCYLKSDFNVKEGDILLDAGVAEGNFALEVIEKVKKVYLVEADRNWLEALKYTFAPYREKVEIIEGFLGKGIAGEITIDEIIGDGELNFIKMDIEGCEKSALIGAKKVLRRENVKLDVCTYHGVEDYHKIADLLEEYGYYVESSRGYMVFITLDNFMDINKPELVRGLARGVKKIL